MEQHTYSLPTPLLQLISSEQAYHYKVIPIAAESDTIVFKTATPSSNLKKELSVIFGKAIVFETDSIENINLYLSTNFRKQTASKTLHFTNDFLENILLSAKDIGSSDIHFEPYEHKCRVRFRLDGKLKEHFIIALSEYPKTDVSLLKQYRESLILEYLAYQLYMAKK
jgi:type IV pilus assembly protein PilB